MAIVQQETRARRPADVLLRTDRSLVGPGVPGDSDALLSVDDRRRDDRRQIAVVALIGLILSSFLMVGWFNRPLAIPSPGTWVQGRVLSNSYDPPTNKVELFLNQGDGQIFAHHAQDPFLRHPDGIRGPAAERAYRLQRPLYGWLGWLVSAGRSGAVGWSLVVVTVLSVSLLGAAVAWGCRHLGTSPLWGLLVYVTPGVLENLLRVGPESLGTALVVLGLIMWICARPSPWLAVACFATAGLCRESLLIVPVALAVADLLPAITSHGLRVALARTARSPLAASFVPFLTWVLVLRIGLGTWPSGTIPGRLSIAPFGGLAATVGQLSPKLVVSFLLIALPAAVALVVACDRRLKAVVTAHVLLAATFGPLIWPGAGFVRVLLPLSVISLLAAVDGVARRSHAETGDGQVRTGSAGSAVVGARAKDRDLDRSPEHGLETVTLS